MTTTTPQPRAQTQTSFIREFPIPLPGWVARRPDWMRVGVALVALVALSLYIRTDFISDQFWMDEAITVGISSHSLSSIPGILRMDGSPPLFYLLLHFWMQMVGNSQIATHWLSEIFGALTIPAGYWAGRSLYGNRAGLVSASLFTLNGFLDYYAVETRMYELMALLGLLATIAFIQGFVLRRRKYVAMFSGVLALMFYTHAWAIYFSAGSVLSLVILWIISDEQDRQGMIKDAAMAYGVAVILFAPWIPNFIFQVVHTAAPWDNKPRFGALIQISQNVLGGVAISVALVFTAGIGYANLVTKRLRSTREAKIALMLLCLIVFTFMLAWIGSQMTPSWVVRYFAPVVPAILLLLGFGMSRAGVLTTIVLTFTFVFMARPHAFIPQYKSNMQNIAGEMDTYLRPHDLVIVGQPEETPLAYYYIGLRGLNWANTIGPVKDPSYMDWVNALARYRAANPEKVLPRMINALKPGQQVLYIRSLTEGEINWKAPWTTEVQDRSAQWGAILTNYVRRKQLVVEAFAPHNYPGSCCVANSAVLYKKVS